MQGAPFGAYTLIGSPGGTGDQARPAATPRELDNLAPVYGRFRSGIPADPRRARLKRSARLFVFVLRRSRTDSNAINHNPRPRRGRGFARGLCASHTRRENRATTTTWPAAAAPGPIRVIIQARDTDARWINCVSRRRAD